MNGIIRVFPRKTRATPDDVLAFTGSPTRKFLNTLDKESGDNVLEHVKKRREVHVSTTFTYDIPKAEQLAEDWQKAGFTVKVGGAAFNDSGGEFTPGMYLKDGFTITSRGCYGSCWFCSVHKREGGIRELEIKDGYNIFDSNVLACSESHIRAVFEMLSRQVKRPIFSGGLDSRLLSEWHVNLLRTSKAERMYFAYDSKDDFEPLIQAGRLLRNGGIKDSSGHKLKCYVLIGFPGDTQEEAEKRLFDTWRAGFMPYSMLYRNESGETAEGWKSFQRTWLRPQIVYSMLREVRNREI